MPSYNSGDYILEAVESALSQMSDEDELLIQDGGSTDGSVQLLADRYGADARLKLVSAKDEGQSDALTKALARARNPFVGWLNADDIVYPGALDAVRTAIAENPDVDIVYGNGTLFTDDGTIIRVHVPAKFTVEDFVRQGCHVFSGAAFIRAEQLRAVPFERDLYYCMDYDLFIRLAERTPRTVYVDRNLAGLRRNPDAKTAKVSRRFVAEAYRIRMRYAHTLRARVAVWLITGYHLLAYAARPIRHSRIYSRLRGARTY